jgi:hypothetical protein
LKIIDQYHDIAESGIKHNKSIKSNLNQFVEGGQDLVEAEEIIWTYLKYNVYTCSTLYHYSSD